MPDVDHALAGARDILAERIADDADVRGQVRDLTRAEGVIKSRVATAKKDEVSKFQDYYDFSQPLTELPSHRMLAMRRGEDEGFLVLARSTRRPSASSASSSSSSSPDTRRRDQMRLVVQDAYKRLIAPAVEVDLRLELKTQADEEAITIFGRNLEQLLLAPPAGERIVIGLDPGFRTGVKVAALSRTGAVVATDTWMLHQPDRFAQSLLALVAKHRSGSHLDRQRHGVARDGDARARHARRATACRARRSSSSTSRARRSTRRPTSRARSCPTSTSRCAARCRSRDACRIRSPSW